MGGGAQLPLLRDWLSKRARTVPLLSAPPVEAVAKGALSLTPGVRVRDVLQRGVSLRCWDRRSGRDVDSTCGTSLVLACIGVDLVKG